MTLLLIKAIAIGMPALATSRAGWDEKLALLREAEAAVAALPRLEDSAKTLRSAFVGLAPALLAGPSDADAVAELSARVVSIVSAAHGRLGAVSPESDSGRVGQLQQVSIRIAWETDIKGVGAVLQLFALSPLALTPESIRISATDPFASDHDPERLQVELVVSGWFVTAAQ